MLQLVAVALATYWAWATARDLIPWDLPGWTHPAIVFAGTLALAWPDWRTAMAASGGVLFLHLIASRLLTHTPTRTPPRR